MSDEVPVVTAPELVRRLAAREAGTDEFLLIDVREPAEYAQASIPGAILVPLGSVFDGTALADLPRDQEIVVHCQVGARSLTAAKILRGAGFDASKVSIAGFTPGDGKNACQVAGTNPAAGSSVAKDTAVGLTVFGDKDGNDPGNCS